MAAVHEFGDPRVFDLAPRSLGEALETEVATIRTSAEELEAWAVEHVRLRAGFHELVEACEPLIVSSGLEQLIRPVLARECVEVELRCNSAEPRPEGWRIRFRDEERCRFCRDRCKRSALPPGPVVYVGDGYSDRCAALAAERVFARDGLAKWLDGHGIAYEPFDDLFDVLRADDIRMAPR